MIQTNDENSIEDMLEDTSNRVGLAFTVLAELGFGMYALNLSGENMMVAAPIAALGGVAAFGLGKSAYKVIEKAQRVKQALVFGIGVIALGTLLSLATHYAAADSGKLAAQLKAEDAQIRQTLEGCNYFIDGRRIGVKQSGIDGEILGNPELLNGSTLVQLYSAGSITEGPAKISALIGRCELIRELQASGALPREVPKKYVPNH